MSMSNSRNKSAGTLSGLLSALLRKTSPKLIIISQYSNLAVNCERLKYIGIYNFLRSTLVTIVGIICNLQLYRV